MYFKGEGIPQGDVQAIAWYRKAADQGFPLAQQSLASMYFKGQGLQQDYAQALVPQANDGKMPS
jgi:TPR repeat protein